MRTKDAQKKLLEALKENHIVLAVCRKTGIGKSSFYRWCQEDLEFAAAADEAIREGIELVNNAAESNVISKIKERDIEASKFWLKHNHPTYATRVKIETEKPEDPMTPEQEEIVRKALTLDAVPAEVDITHPNEHTEHAIATTESSTGVGGENPEGQEGTPGSNPQ